MQLLQFILGLAALIFIHELGHFLAARLLKVDVEEFGIGFPPRIWKIFEYKGTVYSINAIPLGGFVRLKGENDPSVPGGFASANPWVRLAVLFAGPFMNLMVGILLAVMFIYTLGDPDNPVPNTVFVRSISAGSPAESAGLQPGDYFVTINDQEIDTIATLQALIDESAGTSTELLMKRGDQFYSVTLVPRLHPPEGEGEMGVLLGTEYASISLTTAAQRGFSSTVNYVHNLVSLPVKMIQGQVAPEQGRLVGYKGMYDIYQYFQSPLWFFSIISISLGIMNLLPIPALDGGRIVLTLPEILIRRRIPPEYENAIHAVGLVILLILLIYINLQDFINPVNLNPPPTITPTPLP